MPFKSKHTPWNKGMKGFLAGESHYAWKGDKVGYFALHMWITRKLGKANRCTQAFCIYPRRNRAGTLMLAPKAYHWANISGLYKRDIRDWKQMCASCHRSYDAQREPTIKNKYPVENKGGKTRFIPQKEL